MITAIQHFISKKGKFVFVLLLLLVVVSFVLYLSQGSSVFDLFSDEGRDQKPFFQYDWNNPDQRRFLTVTSRAAGSLGALVSPVQEELDRASSAYMEGMQNQMQNPMQNEINQQLNSTNTIINNSEQSNNYNELINQIQKASISGATSLPSRDIPIDPTHVKNDIETKPNFIPEPNTEKDYINNLETPNELIEQNNRIMQNNNNIDLFYNELKLPLIICLIYFLFQLPIIKKYSLKMMPSLFGKDGNPNLSGNVVNSILFSLLFYIIIKFMNYLNLQ